MCMLFGFSGERSYELNKCIRDFFNYSVRNPDGWGIGVYNKNNVEPVVVKEAKPAYLSRTATTLTEGSIPGKLAIAHIRYATFGEVKYVNTHPFMKTIKGKKWIFAHNGSIRSTEINNVSRKAYGDTDSEKVFMYISEKLEKLPDGDNLDNIVLSLEESISSLSRYGKLNLLITNGEYLFVHTNYKESLYLYENAGYTCFSTQPLIGVLTKNKWTNVPMNRLFVYKNGKMIFKGTSHKNEYFNIRGMKGAV